MNSLKKSLILYKILWFFVFIMSSWIDMNGQQAFNLPSTLGRVEIVKIKTKEGNHVGKIRSKFEIDSGQDITVNIQPHWADINNLEYAKITISGGACYDGHTLWVTTQGIDDKILKWNDNCKAAKESSKLTFTLETKPKEGSAYSVSLIYNYTVKNKTNSNSAPATISEDKKTTDKTPAPDTDKVNAAAEAEAAKLKEQVDAQTKAEADAKTAKDKKTGDNKPGNKKTVVVTPQPPPPLQLTVAPGTMRKEREIEVRLKNHNNKNYEIDIKQNGILLEEGTDYLPNGDKEPNGTELVYRFYSFVKGGKITVQVEDKYEEYDFSQQPNDEELRFYFSNDYAQIRILGGMGPFRLFWADNSAGRQRKSIDIPSRVQSINEIWRAIPEEQKGEKIYFDIEDQNQNRAQGEFIELPKPRGIDFSDLSTYPIWLKALIVLGALVLLALAFWKQLKGVLAHWTITRMMFGLKAPQPKKATPPASNGIPQDLLPSQVEPNKASDISIVKKSKQIEVHKTEKSADVVNDSGKIVITRKAGDANRQLAPSNERGAWNPDMRSMEYYPFDLNPIWMDTAVSKVLIRHGCAAVLDKVVRDAMNMYDIQKSEALEIGGWLFGRYTQLSNGQYQVSLEEYVPASTAMGSDVYEVELETDSLDDARDQYPHLELIGWFHTHPGHQLFLSKSDLRIHEGFFRKPFQVAMELDSLTKGFDVAFFTWRSNGGINKDTVDRRQDTTWFKWRDVEDWRLESKRFLA